MTLKQFLREKVGWIFGIVFQLFLVTVFGKAFQVNSSFLVCVYFMELLVLFLMWGNDFQKRRAFYNDMQRKLDDLDKKYLLTEMIEPPGFLEGDIFCEALYETNKSMNEWVGERERSVKEFKDYVEMWIHEIKLPISALSLMNYNEKTDIRLYRPQIDKISHYVEQILYYVRADAPQKDFLMTRCCLKKLIQEVLLEHKDVLITGKFSIEQKGTEAFVVSDAKWITFILGQLVNNSIKYQKGETGYLGFEVEESDDNVVLSIEDHGIGVPASDLKRVFDKSFTGENGRRVASSTGMGLYICRKMCKKLGHEIWMSRQGEFTRVIIRFGKDQYYV